MKQPIHIPGTVRNYTGTDATLIVAALELARDQYTRLASTPLPPRLQNEFDGYARQLQRILDTLDSPDRIEFHHD